MELPRIYKLLTTGNSLAAVLKSADISSGDPEVLANMVLVTPERMRIFELGGRLYIMHPSLILNPVILVAYLLGVPFLLWRLKSSLSAQLLLGVLLVSTFVCYVPPVVTFVGDNIVLPGQLWRLAWPIPLAAFMILGWMAREAMKRAETYLSRLRLLGVSALISSLCNCGGFKASATSRGMRPSSTPCSRAM